MFSSKKNVLETVALLKAFDINQVVLSPGSRNAPLVDAFTRHPFFDTHLVVDERNAAFFALGIIQKTQKPVAVCCTSGTALLNYAPAVAEAYYAGLPLIVISADRAPEWIGQMDGQTILQLEALAGIVKKRVQIPEINTETDLWYANRLLNEALIACTSGQPGPVHINVPLSEPLLDLSEPELPPVRKINYVSPQKAVTDARLQEFFEQSPRKLVIVGQLFPSAELNAVLESLAQRQGCVVLAENLANLHSPAFISNFDLVLAQQKRDEFVPDLVISVGGHIISKRFKHFLRKHKPQRHWHFSQTPEVVDLYQSLTDLIEADPLPFLKTLAEGTQSSDKSFYDTWQTASKTIEGRTPDVPFSDIAVTGKLIDFLPQSSALHLANSSAVRNAQLFSIDPTVTIYSNRGTNGIDSSLPSTIGYAAVSEELTFLLIGDLSFFYAVGSLWNLDDLKNLRILLINNRGGAIFHHIPGMEKSPALPGYIAAEHDSSAQAWAIAGGFSYLCAACESELEEALPEFTSANSEKPVILEVFTDVENDKTAFEMYFVRSNP